MQVKHLGISVIRELYGWGIVHKKLATVKISSTHDWERKKHAHLILSRR